MTIGELVFNEEQENFRCMRAAVLAESGTSEFQMRLPQWNAFCSRLHDAVHGFGVDALSAVMDVEKEAEDWLTSKRGRRLYPTLRLPV